MGNLVHPGIDRRQEAERSGNVSRNAHAESMCLGDDGPNDSRRNEVVQLDLLEAEVVVTPHHGAAFLGSGGIDRPERAGPAAIHQAGHERSRSERTVRCHCVAKRNDEVEVVPHVAHGGHAGGEVHGCPLHLHDVGVHVP